MALILSGRVIVYTNEVPYETDILRTNLYQCVDVWQLAQTILGTGISNAVLAAGLPCAPISPPGMSVVVGPGVMYAPEFLDATAYGVLPVDVNPNHIQYKQGINLDPQTFATPAPTTSPGDYIIYLIQGEFQTQDVNNVSRPYFNSADPTMPIFNANYDTRQDLVHLSIKPSAPAPSPTPPTPDAGYTALYYVQVAYGQTSVISGNITVVPGAPFITESLTQKISQSSGDDRYVQYAQYQNQSPVYGNDVGSLNAYALTLSPVPSALVIGMKVSILAANTNTGAATFTLNSLATGDIQTADGNALISGYMIAGSAYELQYLGSNIWQLINPTIPAAIPAGFMMDFAGTAAPLGWLALTANNAGAQNVSRSTYAALFSAISTTWGVGDGSTTFGLPPGARNVMMGAGGTGSGVIGNAVGNKGGAETHTLSIGEIPNHTHAPSSGQFDLNVGSGGSSNFVAGTQNTSSTATGGIPSYPGQSGMTIVQPAIISLRCIKY